MSQPSRPLNPALVQAVAQAVQAELPAGEPLTLDALEEAILTVLQQLGPAVAQEIAVPTTAGPQKKGHRRSAAGSPYAGSGGVAGCS
jgi:hypothetical protein